MSRKISLLAAAALLTAGLATSAQASANLVTNGSFETTPAGPVDSSGGYEIYPVADGTSIIPGWGAVYGAGEITDVGPTNPFVVSASDGSWSLDLTGYSDSSVHGAVQQTLATQAGHTYTLSFDIGDSDYYDRGADGVGIRVGLGAFFAQDYYYDGSNTVNPRSNSWSTVTQTFVAHGSSTLLILGGVRGNQYIGLDNVSVVDTTPAGGVPEPASWALMLVGFGGLGAALRGDKRRRSAAA